MTTASPSKAVVPIAADTAIGTVRLTVSDLDSSRSFYERELGMRAVERADGTVELGAGGGEPLLVLAGDRLAPVLDPRRTGLYHLAILVPTRRDLAASLLRLARTRWPLQGASDHLVSEALYLADPDGNGIEIYRDRPRPDWPRDGEQLQMATLPLDLEDVLGELDGGAEEALPAGTRIGHVHLQVANLPSSEAFYSGTLGFDVTVRGYPGALFVSAGGYHHHIGLNTWHSRDGSAPSPGAIGLRSFEVHLPDEASLREVLDRVQAAGVQAQPVDGGTLVRDPSGNGVLLRS